VGVNFTTPVNEERSLRESAATNWHANMAGDTIQMAQIFRPLDDIKVVGSHWIYVGTSGGSRVEYQYGGKPDAMIGVPYVVEHRTFFRTEKQILDGRAFCNDRIMVVARTGQEDDVPGLPAPVWDYETIPYPGRLSPDAKEDDVVPPKVKAPKDQPFRVLTLAEANHALQSGYEKVFVKVNDGLMAPELSRDEIVLLSPGTPAEGDLTLAHVLGHWRIRRVADVTPTGRAHVKSDRSPATHLVARYGGKVIWHGAKEAHYVRDQAKAEAKAAEPEAVKRRGRPPKTEQAAPAKRGRPRKTVPA
jgi:hypothetical protein